MDIINPCPAIPTGPVPTHLFFTLINALMQTKCQLNNNYPKDYSEHLSDNDEFDFIIIGGGSAGSVVANKLSENENWKILLLEAGTIPSTTSEIPCLLFSLQETEEDWQYTVEPSKNACLGIKNGKCRWPRGKLIGGTSAINAMLYLRGNKQDYDKWSEKNPNWHYEKIIENYKFLEKLQENILENNKNYGRTGHQYLTKYNSTDPMKNCIINAINELNINYYEQQENIGYFQTLMTINNGKRANSAKSFLGHIKRKNLFVSYKSEVEKLIINNETKTVQQLIVNVNNKKIHLKIKKEAILSSGAINSPKILMLSGIGPAAHLHNLKIPIIENLPVGQNLQDHIYFFGIFASIQNEEKEDIDEIEDFFNYFYKQTGKLSEIGITNLVGFINTKNNSQYPNIQFHHVIHTRNDKYLLPTILNVIGLNWDIQKQFLEINKNSRTIHILPTLLNPKSLGEIQLKSSNPAEKPIIFANYFNDKADLEIFLESIHFLEKLFETKSFRKFKIKLNKIHIEECDNHQYNSDDYWLCMLKYLSTSVYHPVGTCKMGPKTDPESVVDSRLKVHNLRNLRVIDASIMPTITSCNTNGPTLAIGRYGATMIQEDWSNSHEEL